jgi:hypothetical protein
MSIDSLDDVQAGDLMFASQAARSTRTLVNTGEWLMHDNFEIGEFSVGHVAVVIPGGKIVEAMPHGARIRDFTPADWGPHTAFVRLPEDYPGQALDAAAVAEVMVGTPYSILSYVYIALFLAGLNFNWLAKRINRRLPVDVITLPSGRVINVALPVEEICSVLAEQSWTLTGKKVVVGTAPQVVTPGMLARQLWERLGVLKGAFWFNR